LYPVTKREERQNDPRHYEQQCPGGVGLDIKGKGGRVGSDENGGKVAMQRNPYRDGLCELGRGRGFVYPGDVGRVQFAHFFFILPEDKARFAKDFR